MALRSIHQYSLRNPILRYTRNSHVHIERRGRLHGCCVTGSKHTANKMCVLLYSTSWWLTLKSMVKKKKKIPNIKLTLVSLGSPHSIDFLYVDFIYWAAHTRNQRAYSNWINYVKYIHEWEINCSFSGFRWKWFIDFPGMCFASTRCATVEPGKSWDLTPFCGKSTCVAANDNNGR